MTTPLPSAPLGFDDIEYLGGPKCGETDAVQHALLSLRTLQGDVYTRTFKRHSGRAVFVWEGKA